MAGVKRIIIKTVRILLVLFALLAIFLLVAGAVVVNRPEMLGLAGRLENGLAEVTGLECKVAGPVEIGVFPLPYAQIYRVTMFAPGSSAPDSSAPAAAASEEKVAPGGDGIPAANATASGGGETSAAAMQNGTAPGPVRGSDHPPSRRPLLTLSAARAEFRLIPLLWGEVDLRGLKILDPVLDLDALREYQAASVKAAPPAQLPAVEAAGAVSQADPPSVNATVSLNATEPAPAFEAGNASLPAQNSSAKAPGVSKPGGSKELAGLLDLLLDTEIRGGVVLDSKVSGKGRLLASGISLNSGGDDILLSLSSPLLAEPGQRPLNLRISLKDLSLRGNELTSRARLVADFDIYDQSLRPDISADLTCDVVKQSLKFANFSLALEKLRIKGDFAAALTNDGFSAVGHLEHQHLSLPRWFRFGRNLPGSLQYALDDASGSMDFDLNQDRLKVSNMVTKVLGMTLRGSGGTADFSKPEVLIDAKSSFLDVNVLFPEVIDPPVENVPRVHYAMQPLVGADGVDESDLPDVGYDIRIAGDTALVRKLKVEDLAVRIVPSPRGTQCLFSLGQVAKGEMSADLTVLGEEHKIEIDAKPKGLAVEILGRDLFERAPLQTLVSGRAKVKANPNTLDEFFRTMDVDFDLAFGKGSLALRRSGRTLVFDSAAASGVGASTAGQSASNSMLTFVGNWNFSAVSGKEKIKATLKGQLGVDENSLDLASYGGNLSATANPNMAFLGLDPGKESKFTGLFDYDDRASTLALRKAVFNLPYGTAKGDVSSRNFGLASEAWSGVISLALPSTRAWFGYMGFAQDNLPESGLGKGLFSFKFEQSGSKWSIKEADILLDDKVKGRLEIVQAGDKNYAFAARLEFLNLDDYYPPHKNYSLLPSPRPWDLSGLMKMRVKGDISVKDLAWRKLHYTNFTAQVALDGGKFNIPAHAGFYGGQNQTDLSGTLEAGRINSQFKLDFKGAQLASITRALYDDERASGPLNISLLANGSPTRSSELLTAFSGNWAFDVGAGYFRGKRDAVTGKEPSKTKFSAIRASGLLRSGRLESDNFTLSAPGSTDTVGHGYVDLDKNAIEMDLLVRMLGIDVPVRLYGSLDAPQTSVKSGQLIGNAVGGIGSGLFGLVVDVITLPGKVITLPFSNTDSKPEPTPAPKESGSGTGSGSSGSGAFKRH